MVHKRVAIYIVQKCIKLFVLLLLVSTLSYTLISLSPIDPVQSYIGADMTIVSVEQRESVAEYWGLNEPKTQQFFNWAKSIFQGDFGTSLLYRAPVLTVIGERFIPSLMLMGLAWLFSGVIGFILGIIAGWKEGSWIDKFIKGYCYALATTPAFWLGLVLLIIFSVWLGWLPVGLGTPAGILAEDVTFLQKLKHLILPVITLSIVNVSNVALHTRQKLIDILNQDFIQYAEAKGVKGFPLLYRHVLKNIALPAVSLHFASFGEIFGGSILAEQVFSYPGLGQATVNAGLGGDVPLLLGIVIFSTIFVYTGNTIADVLYKLLDPRIRKGANV